MKKWIYLVIPTILMAGFVLVFISHEKEMKERESNRARQIAEKLASEKREKEVAEAKARESARVAQEEREAAERKKEADRLAKQNAIDREIKDGLDAATAEANRAQMQVNQLQIELDRLNKDRERINMEAFELAKQVELAKVAKRNAELEEQRLIEMIVRRADQSAMAQMPPPPPPPPPAAPAAASRPAPKKR